MLAGMSRLRGPLACLSLFSLSTACSSAEPGLTGGGSTGNSDPTSVVTATQGSTGSPEGLTTTGDTPTTTSGGCHVNRTGDIGLFKILSDRSLAAGVRRIEGLTGRGAVEYFQSLDSATRMLQQQVNAPLAELPAAVRSLQEKQKQLEKELKGLRMKLASGGGGGAAREEDAFVEVDGVKLVARRVSDMSGGDLRNLADTFRSKIKSGVVLLGTSSDGKATLLAAVTSDLVAKISAHSVIQRLAPIVGGKGGGKPDLAQAGGKDPDRLEEAIAKAPEVVRELLAAE